MDGRKRGRNNDAGAVHSNGGFKKHKQETDGIGSKSKPCTKFFSTSGCPFGENCHFLHHVSGGYNAVAQLMNLPPMSRNAPPPPQPPPQSHNGSAPGAKTRLCNKFNSAEGCKYGDKCHFAHGEWELNKPVGLPSFDDPRARGGHPMHGRFSGRHEPPVPAGLGAFGESATAKISVDASLAGAIIGKSGVNSKQICRQTGVKLSIRDHDSDSNKRNIELEGTFDQIKLASEMVHDLVASVSANTPFNKAPGGPAPHGPFSTNYRTKLCENFTKGSCTFGDKCHFAHGAAELRKSGV
ncbi:zinc finger CCCH domain-containing protein 44-like [Chenopodium quinoa]|uniref:zinc finger CCCH domain-containing protein 44-like n=1 Tax=Chenopodium quinoa TaxID=63459 RepID=UPI000B78A64D|nr:zinc finger CCCH domain-containing protein 44-like [Chenopodium quinoa]